MGITKRFLCTALCAILIPSGALAAENVQHAATVDGFVPASERALYDGVTLRSYDLSDRLLDTTDTGRTVSCYGIQDFSAVEFDPAQTDLYLDLVPGGPALGKLSTVSDTVHAFAASASDGKIPIAAINAGIRTESYILSRDRDITYNGVTYAKNLKSGIVLPCGFTVVNGEIISGAQIEQETPYSARYSFGITSDRIPFLALPEVIITVSGAADSFVTDALNRLPVEDAVIIYTDKGPEYNQALDDAYEVVVDCSDNYTVRHGAEIVGTVTEIYAPGGSDPQMKPNRIIMTARGDSAVSKISGYSVGDTVRLDIEVSDALGRSDELLINAESATGGHLPLMIDGEPCSYENLHLTERCSASIIGYTESGSIMLISLDSSKDNDPERLFSISQMSYLARELDLVNALLLDISNSVTMTAADGDGYDLVNIPNGGDERAVTGTLILSHGAAGNAQGDFDIPKLVRFDEDISALRFSDSSMHKYLRTGSGGHIGIDGNVCYDSIDKALHMSAAETDAALSLRYIYAEQCLNLSEYRYISVIYRTDDLPDRPDGNPDEGGTATAQSMTVRLMLMDGTYLPEQDIDLSLPDKKYRYALIDLSQLPGLGGELCELRLELSSSVGAEVSLGSVALFESHSDAVLGSARLTAEVNGDPYIPLGDVNGDGATDIKDIVRLMKSISGGTVETTHTDINGDGVTDVRDIIRLMKMISES